jgi:hypothetical protein
MRLNAVWGLESKPAPVSMGKCALNEEARGDPDVHFPEFGVQFNTKHELNLFCDGQIGKNALDQLVTHFTNQNYSEGYFLYLKPSNNYDPYDLIPLIQYTE